MFVSELKSFFSILPESPFIIIFKGALNWLRTSVLPGYINSSAGEGKCRALPMSQLSFEEERGNSNQQQVH
jgi:hypothetical protein